MILTVIQQPSPILRQKCLPVAKVTAEIKEIIHNMVDTMYNFHGVGLAAPQVGYNIQVIVFDATQERNSPGVLINPEIVSHSKNTVENVEGCLSCKGFEGKVKRFEKVTVKAKNMAGKTVTLKAEGMLARVFQHEIDHLDGVLFIDKAKDLQEITSE